MAADRSAAKVKAPAEAQATDAERILIRALASARQIYPAMSIPHGRERSCEGRGI